MSLKKKIITNNLINFPSLCESFTLRNILEVLALIEGEKTVVRVPIKNHEWNTLKLFCKQQCMYSC